MAAAVNVAGAIVIVGAAIVSVYAFEPVNGAPVPVELSCAVTVKLNVPPAVGVPESVPEEESVKPAGRAPDVTLKL